jgi:hypothetical protein
MPRHRPANRTGAPQRTKHLDNVPELRRGFTTYRIARGVIHALIAVVTIGTAHLRRTTVTVGKV